MKKLLAMLIAVTFWLALFASFGTGSAAGEAVLTLSDAYGTVGSVLTLDVSIVNNPGFDVLQCEIDYDPAILKLRSVAGCIEGNGTFYLPDGSSTAFIYFGLIFDKNNSVLGKAPTVTAEEAKIVRLEFELLSEGETEVVVRSTEALRFDDGYTAIPFSLSAGSAKITVSPISSVIYGDADGDGNVNGRDLLRLRSYMANYNYDAGTSAVQVFSGADANGDGKINGRDVLLLRSYIANYNYDTGTSAVILGPRG